MKYCKGLPKFRLEWIDDRTEFNRREGDGDELALTQEILFIDFMWRGSILSLSDQSLDSMSSNACVNL